MRSLCLAAALLVSACASTPAVRTQCLPLKSYSAGQQAAMAAALILLDPASPVAIAMVDYGQLRAAARAACATPGTGR